MQSAIYFPTLRAKRGEISAIGHLSPEARTRIRPTFDIPKPKAKNKDPKDPIEYHLSDIASELAKNWGTPLSLFVDFSQYGPDEKAADGRHPVEYFLDCTRQLRLLTIPAAGPESIRGPGYGYLNAIARAAHRDGRGVAIRLPYRELNRPDSLSGVVDDTLKGLSVPPSMVDVFFDFEALAILPPEARSEEALLTVVIDAMRAIEGTEFRNLVLCGSSIPDQVGPKHNWNALRVPRVELNVWERVVARDANILVKFGDYGIGYAFERDSDEPVRPPSRIRLSTPTHHVLCRAPRPEYRALCAQVTKSADFDAAFETWGNLALYECGEGGGGAGGPTDWVARDTNLHLEGTMRRIEAILDRYGRLKDLEFAKPEHIPWLQSRIETSETP